VTNFGHSQDFTEERNLCQYVFSFDYLALLPLY